MARKAARKGRKPSTPAGSTAAAAEVERFAAQAEAWWDSQGAFRPLHRLNPVRLEFIRDRACRHFGRDPMAPAPLAGLRVIDIGCGGGLLAEPMCRLGAHVTGIDAAAENIATARRHAELSGLAIDYHARLPEDLAREKGRFDLVLNMEVIEHVADLDAFFAAAAGLMAPGGAMALSTLNRTLKSLALAKVGAEYILRWLPAGTHDWRKFVRPSELAAGLRRAGVEITELRGMTYSAIADDWRLSDDLAVNYLAFAAGK